MKIKLTVFKTKETKNGNFLITLKADDITINHDLGTSTTKGRKFYVGVDKDLPVGSQHEVELDNYIQEERPFSFDDDEGKQVNVQLTYLKPRVQ